MKYVLATIVALAILVGVFFLGRTTAPNTPSAPAAAVEQSAPAAPAATAAPTPAPTDPAAPTAAECPTTGEVKNLTGVDVQRLGTEPCAWVWRGAGAASTTGVCPEGWICTFDVVDDIVVVHHGIGQQAVIRAGTWRFIAAYTPDDVDVCRIFKKERDFGQAEVPSFKVRYVPVEDGTLGPIGPQSCP
jgi:hypothetical protein